VRGLVRVTLVATVAFTLIGARPLAAQPEPPAPQPAPPIPPPDRMVLFGDSIAVSIGDALELAAAAQGIFLHNASRSGCSQIDGITTTSDRVPFPWSTGCASGNAAFQRENIATYQPDVVVWLSTWESVDRILDDGTWARFGSFAGNPRILAEIEDAVGRLTAGGARLVVVIPAPVPPGASNADHAAIVRLPLLTSVLREYARQHADRVFVVEMAELICPVGPPCPTVIDGYAPRPDGMHFDDPAGARWVADWLVPKLLAPVIPAAPAPGRTTAGVGAA
jgi:hypothetical protein